MLDLDDIVILQLADDLRCGFTGDPSELGQLSMGELEIDPESSTRLDPFVTREVIEGRPNPRFRLVEVEHLDLTPGISAAAGQGLQDRPVDHGMLYQARELTTAGE